MTKSDLVPAVSSQAASEMPAVLAAGTLVAERYRILGLLGQGGMGAVYRVEHVHMRKAFALKVLHADALRVPEIVARFEREAIAAAKIAHRNVVAATDFGKLPDGSFFLVLELVDGRSLRSELDAGALAPARATKIMRGIVSAVAAAHAKGIVHRDLKPENVMLVRRDGDDDFVKVLDFGIAKLADADATSPESGVQPLTRLGAIMGTPDYMSPEQALGQPVDLRSDLYTLGVIFFELLTGACPFHGSPLTVLRQHITEAPPSVPADLVAQLGPHMSEVISKLLAKEPRARFQTATDLLAALDATGPTARRASVADAPAAIECRSTPALPEPSPAIVTPRVTAGQRIAVICAAAVIIAGLVTTAALSASSKQASEPTPIASQSATASQTDTAMPPAIAAPQPAVASSPTTAVPSVSSAPPTSSSRSPASRPSRGRKTGPGGIYIPPPREWVK